MLPLSLSIGACAVEEDEASEPPVPATPAAAVAGSGQNAAPVEEAESVTQFQNTAWRSISEDGARFTTYFDPDGTYRDLRNGDPYQTGTWEFSDGETLCFFPEEEGNRGDCWNTGALRGDTLSATRVRDEFRIELERVDYAAPDTGEEDGGGEAAETS
ncbi:hypothetical protein GRI38_11590 [Altererythrobacter aurantiacus]|uniref:Uncharacterized protein n=1 Tax=Parapontixanthobacter aurantiacus TaxID=1463599 RepID=A0A844ZIA1_9SPHN|nr:hypothetical protein [Parapontixanthobacter aurantiacus]MXO86667.1 hypothetical protein [Parapontixanthobacter aurantiacus]